jgi:hypothetical protein
MNPEMNFSGDPFLQDLDQEKIKNFCSWLLNFNKYELPLLSYAISVILSESFTVQERTVIGSIFSTIATNTFLIAAQQGFLIQFKNSAGSSNESNNKDISKRLYVIEEILKRNGMM